MSAPKKSMAEIIQELMDMGLDRDQILDRTGNRISRATFYRWKKGETGPAQHSHTIHFRNLYYREKAKRGKSDKFCPSCGRAMDKNPHVCNLDF